MLWEGISDFCSFSTKRLRQSFEAVFIKNINKNQEKILTNFYDRHEGFKNWDNFLTKQKYSVELTVPNKDDYEQK